MKKWWKLPILIRESEIDYNAFTKETDQKFASNIQKDSS